MFKITGQYKTRTHAQTFAHPEENRLFRRVSAHLLSGTIRALQKIKWPEKHAQLPELFVMATKEDINPDSLQSKSMEIEDTKPVLEILAAAASMVIAFDNMPCSTNNVFFLIFTFACKYCTPELLVDVNVNWLLNIYAVELSFFHILAS